MGSCINFLRFLKQVPETRWLKTTEIDCLTFLEARNPKGGVGRAVPSLQTSSGEPSCVS